MATSPIAELRRELDHDGCAFGQVSRERVAHLADAVAALEQKLSYLLVAVSLQLVGFFLGVVLYLLNRPPAH